MIAFLNGFFIFAAVLAGILGFMIVLAMLTSIHPIFGAGLLALVFCTFGGFMYKNLQ